MNGVWELILMVIRWEVRYHHGQAPNPVFKSYYPTTFRSIHPPTHLNQMNGSLPGTGELNDMVMKRIQRLDSGVLQQKCIWKLQDSRSQGLYLAASALKRQTCTNALVSKDFIEWTVELAGIFWGVWESKTKLEWNGNDRQVYLSLSHPCCPLFPSPSLPSRVAVKTS